MSVSTTPLARSARAVEAPTRPASTRLPSHAAGAAILVLAAELQREVWTTANLDADERLPLAVLALAMSAALAVCRRAPLAAVIAGFTALALVDFIASPWDVAPALGFATLPLAYVLGRHTQGTPRTIGTLVAATAVVFVAARYATNDATSDFPIGSAITQVALSLAPIWLGATMRDRAALHQALAASAARAEADREAALERTVLDERSRIAGELHDLIAHALSAVIVQAGVARVHAPRGGTAATEAFAAVETTGRDALTEIRSMLDVLRAPGDDHHDPTVLEPQPRVEHLPRLVARTPIDATLTVEGTERPLPPSVDLTAYRVVQEALEAAETSRAEHARITLTFEPAALTLTVTDDGAAERAPLATRERVRLYGGELAAQAQRGGGFRLRARLPIREAS